LERSEGNLSAYIAPIGDEAGVKTGVRAHFNPVKIEVETSEAAYKTIHLTFRTLFLRR